MDTKQDPREVTYTSKILSEGTGPVEVTATFTKDDDGFPEKPKLMVGNLDICFFVEKGFLAALDIEALDALYAELEAERRAAEEDRAAQTAPSAAAMTQAAIASSPSVACPTSLSPLLSRWLL